MEKYSFFSTNIIKHSLDIDNEKIRNFCTNYQKTHGDEGRKVSNVGGYQSKLMWGNDLSTLEDLYPLFDHTLYHCNNYFSSYAKTDKYELYLNGVWLNINPTHTYNSEHLHPHAYYSCVYYVQCDEDSGPIRFYHPCDFFEYDWKIDYLKDEDSFERMGAFAHNVWFKTQEQELLIFPSWSKHSVDPNKSVTDRISIAMNICVREKNETCQ